MYVFLLFLFVRVICGGGLGQWGGQWAGGGGGVIKVQKLVQTIFQSDISAIKCHIVIIFAIQLVRYPK